MTGMICFAGVLALLPGAGGCADAQADAAEPRGNAESFAIVELFTSEGCSSCPPADDLVAELAKDARAQGRVVYLLAFHVDYWDRLGWRDPFGSRAFSQRQQQYARTLQTENVYTPQMIVNGGAEFVGSDRKRARQEIARALKRPAGAALTLKVVAPDSADTWALQYDVAPAADRHVLQVAVVERGLVTDVSRGENAGRSLRHENVVREFQTIPLENAASGTIPLKLAAGVLRELSSVIAYVQNPADLSIVAAAAVDLDKTTLDKTKEQQTKEQPSSAGK